MDKDKYYTISELLKEIENTTIKPKDRSNITRWLNKGVIPYRYRGCRTKGYDGKGKIEINGQDFLDFVFNYKKKTHKNKKITGL